MVLAAEPDGPKFFKEALLLYHSPLCPGLWQAEPDLPTLGPGWRDHIKKGITLLEIYLEIMFDTVQSLYEELCKKILQQNSKSCFNMASFIITRVY